MMNVIADITDIDAAVPRLAARRVSWSAVAKWALLAWAILLVSPVRMWPQAGGVDSTWVFALNWAAAHGLAFGRDVVFTSGPLAWLTFPQPVGDNLARGVLFQCCVWVLLAGVLADLFLRGGLRLANLALFTLLLATSAPLFWFNYIGLQNLLIAALAVLFLLCRLRGERWRYLVALLLIGIIPLVKLTGGMIAGGMLIGFLTDHAIRLRSRGWKDVVLAVVLPAATFGVTCCFLFPSVAAVGTYIKESLDLATGYSSAMSLAGEGYAAAAAAEVFLLLGAFLITAVRKNALRRFLIALFALPLFLSFKHGFVRQDMHEINFFCFAGLTLAITALVMTGDRRRIGLPLILVFGYSLIWLEYMNSRIGHDAFREAAGISSAKMLKGALHLSATRDALIARSIRKCELLSKTDPAIRGIIGDAPVASMSEIYDGAGYDGLNLRLYPVIQRYSAYTPYLDHLNAAWIQDKGPRFLVSDFVSIDGRQPWMETPDMWYETWRWYDLRLLGKNHVLLERRRSPRISRLESMRRSSVPFGTQIVMPSDGAEFWSAKCGMSLSGNLRKLLFRVPEVLVTIRGIRERIIPEVLSAPVPIRLPNTLAEFASMFDGESAPPARVRSLSFGGPGASSYGSCEVEFFRAVP